MNFTVKKLRCYDKFVYLKISTKAHLDLIADIPIAFTLCAFGNCLMILLIIASEQGPVRLGAALSTGPAISSKEASPLRRTINRITCLVDRRRRTWIATRIYLAI